MSNGKFGRCWMYRMHESHDIGMSRQAPAGSSERGLKQHRGHGMAKWSPPDGEGCLGVPLLNSVVQLAPLVVGFTILFKQKKLWMLNSKFALPLDLRGLGSDSVHR
jgi:hypothetical protein